jgi:hypothetical protein
MIFPQTNGAAQTRERTELNPQAGKDAGDVQPPEDPSEELDRLG